MCLHEREAEITICPELLVAMGTSQQQGSPMNRQTDTHELAPSASPSIQLKHFSEGYEAAFLQPKPATPYVTHGRQGAEVIHLAAGPLRYFNNILMSPPASQLQSTLHLSTPLWPPLETSIPFRCFSLYS